MREDVLPELKMSVSEAARQLRVSHQTLHRILAGTAAVTPGRPAGEVLQQWAGAVATDAAGIRSVARGTTVAR